MWSYISRMLKKTDFKDIQHSYHETIDGDHGRIEVRRHWVVSDIDWLDAKPAWKGLNSIGMIERERDIDDKVSCETSYYILSQKCNGKVFGKCLESIPFKCVCPGTWPDPYCSLQLNLIWKENFCGLIRYKRGQG